MSQRFAEDRAGQSRVMPCSGSSPKHTTLEGPGRDKYTPTSGQAVLSPKLCRPRTKDQGSILWTPWDKPMVLLTHQIQAGTVPCSPEIIPSLGQDQPHSSPGISLPVLCSSSRAELSPGRGFPANSPPQVPGVHKVTSLPALLPSSGIW